MSRPPDQPAEFLPAMTAPPGPAAVTIRAADLPLDGIARPLALALITGTAGAAYRPVGAFMAIGEDGRSAGNLSSGCIDADVVLHGAEVIRTGEARQLRYGLGSPFLDLTLPCGGGLDIRVLPVGDGDWLERVRAGQQARRPVDLFVSATAISAAPLPDADLRIRVVPDLRFLAFGKGPEVTAFAGIAAGAGYDTLLFSPDDETLAQAGHPAIRRMPLRTGHRLADDLLDRHTAVTLFFHDHDLEPHILLQALQSDAFYIGAQGSRRTAARRLAALREMGLPESALGRLRGPVGLIPSTRDARTLAVSVLAEVLAEATAAA